jgi:signal transduction histidine kinase
MTAPAPQGTPSLAIATVAIRHEHDVVFARQRARDVARHLGFDTQAQVRFATAVSELARNVFQYAPGADGRVSFALEREGERSLLVARVRDEGPGIADLERILQGGYRSTTGLGVGLTGARRLSDRFAIESAPGGGTTVVIGTVIAHVATALGPRDAARVADLLAREAGNTPYSELQLQNQELIVALDALRGREREIERLGQELAETNRGVVALYAELADRAEELRLLSETKTRFLSDVSHELRTPLSSIINLSRLLLSHTDGPLAPEQEKQVEMVHRSAQWLVEMVSGLLDVAKIEAGKVELRLDAFTVEGLFAALRGMLRPLVTNGEVALVVEDPAPPIELYTDEQRLAQILRNFVSNALEFTSAGEVHLSARLEGDELVRFTVSDTGVGIAPADQERIFEEFIQVDGPIQRRVRGTGLGLPLTRKLAALLGGEAALESSTPGQGSRFFVLVPRDLRSIGGRDG